MGCSKSARRSLALVSSLSCLAPVAMAQGFRFAEPLPVEAAVDLRSHNTRAPIAFSPDGKWIAHTIGTTDRVARDTSARRFSPTGFPFAEGDDRMEATISNATTGEVITLGSGTSASWGPVWSPDGSRIAFYSDEGGTAGLWIWEEATRRRTRVPDLIVRPFFGFETVRWAGDGSRLVVKALPAGVSVAEANAWEEGFLGQAPRFPRVKADQPSVFVRRFDPKEAAADSAKAATPSAPTGRAVGPVSWARADLVLVDVRSNRVIRLAERAPIRDYAVSPDGKLVAYTVLNGWIENSQQPSFQLVIRDLTGGPSRTLAADLLVGYGIEWNWSPDGKTIAVTTGGQLTDAQIELYPVSGEPVRRLTADSMPRFGTDEGEYAPRWDRSGQRVYAIGDGALYRAEASSGRGALVARIPGWRITTLVANHGDGRVWTTEGDRNAWVIAREESGGRAGIFAVDLRTGRTRALLQEPGSYADLFNVAGSDVTGEIAYVQSNQQQTAEIRLLDTKTGKSRRASRINQVLDRYRLGEAILLDWRTDEGQQLRGTLLLPPGYKAGTKLPMVVWVYGGSMGSEAVNSFGGHMGSLAAFNMHLLATRGYAVLFPDTPLRQGQIVNDLVRTVMPGVDAAIASGYADPDRLAIMGQSFGSYNTLAILTRTTRFKAAVVTAAVLHPDLAADYLRSIGYWERGQGNMGGSLWEQPSRYGENSILLQFDRIQTPVLMGQGNRDGDLTPSDAIFAALERLEKPVEYRLYNGEDHVITGRANVLDFWNRRLAFLAEHLKLSLDSQGAVLFEAGRAK